MDFWKNFLLGIVGVIFLVLVITFFLAFSWKGIPLYFWIIPALVLIAIIRALVFKRN